MLLSYLTYRNACQKKQRDRQAQINALPTEYHAPLTPFDSHILGRPVSELVVQVQTGRLSPQIILTAYGKKALKAQAELNCLTEVLISDAEGWAEECNLSGPLAGVPVSLKDMVNVRGYDSCLGYAAWVGKPAQYDSAIVRLLRDAGAVPFVKTQIPITLLSFESASDALGKTENPHKKGYSPGGSSGGEGALLAYGGSRVGIGSDVAGSLRAPSHYSGVYTIKASSTRFVRSGTATSNAGQEGVLAVYSPMARTLEDLEYFWKAIMSMNPWKYDHTVINLPWREVQLPEKKVKFGVMWTDGVVTPSPACHRALQDVVSSLRDNGYQVVAVNPPSPYEGFKLASSLIADACDTACKKVIPWENNDPGMMQAMRLYHLPRWVQCLYAWYIRYIRRDEIYAGLIDGWHTKSAQEIFALVAKREEYRAKWFDFWDETGLDFIVTCPNAMPAVPHKGMKDAFTNCLYTFLFNLLDYTAGVMPVTKVDKDLDALDPKFKPKNAIEAGAYKLYDAEKLDGLPVGVQVVGRRLQEEKVMEGMKLIQKLLINDGKEYELLQT
ncbi:amidase signature enzyme [Neolentinus lepideus HHB14362 ss-1]|uniref:amidase n=1 Tax=Neolentinus lepideus HHB14362 ss-1 TaxID=1314782 RepID=A0A165PEJ9_9AGAM|nr:amidase signature enzyme [Neolentinus lepideus HHB14362 ss-1]